MYTLDDKKWQSTQELNPVQSCSTTITQDKEKQLCLTTSNTSFT